MDRQSRYTELLKRHLPMVWRGCWVRARGNYERCRDLVQEVSIALWLHLDQLRTDVSPKEEKAWVWWMTRTTLDHLHRSQRPPMVALTEVMAETIPDADNSAVEEDIEELMAALSPEEQQLMRLHIEGYRADEIAETLGLRRDTVYQRMHPNNKAVGSEVEEQSVNVFYVFAAVIGFSIRRHVYINDFVVLQNCGVARRNEIEVMKLATVFIYGNIPVGVVDVFGD